MLETLFLRFSKADDYLDIGVLSFLFTLLAVTLVQHVVQFRIQENNLAGIIVVLLTSLAVAYPFVRYITEQELAELSERWSETRLLHRHWEELWLYMAFFWGVTLAFAVSTFFVPQSFYNVQFQVLQSMLGPTGNLAIPLSLGQIIGNNLWVFAITFVLSFFFSSGIIFILAWNASVLGVAIGQLSHTVLHVPAWTLAFIPHGIPEIGGYVIAGVAGSLLARQVEYTIFNAEHSLNETVLEDVLYLVVIGVAVIFIAGVIEVGVAL